VVAQHVRPRHVQVVEKVDCLEADACAFVVVDEIARVHQEIGLLLFDQAANLEKAAAVVLLGVFMRFVVESEAKRRTAWVSFTSIL
jgi:hypothetical protein